MAAKTAAFLRGFKAIYLGLLMNCVILGWVTLAMVNIITVLLGPAIAEGNVLEIAGLHYTFGAPAHTALMICIFLLIPFTGLYTFIGGLWGVLVTDLFQFVLKMSMIIVLAWVALAKIGGLEVLQVHLDADRGQHTRGWNSGVRSVELPAGFQSRVYLGRHLDPAGAHVSGLRRACNGGWPGIRARNRAAAAMSRSACSAPRTKRIRSAPRCGSTSRTMRCGPGPGSSPDLVALVVYSPNGGINPKRCISRKIRNRATSWCCAITCRPLCAA